MPMKNKADKNEYNRIWKANHKEQIKEYNRQYKLEHHDEMQAYWKEYEKKYRTKRKEISSYYRDLFFKLYGNKCACCGESHEEFLTVEHRLGQIGMKKENLPWRRAVISYRPDLYETLCMNCNFARRFGKICPHQRT